MQFNTGSSVPCFFFGTFDPVHLGHIKIANEIKVQFGFEKIIFVPTPNPPHKESIGASDFERLEMLKLAIGEENVSEIEFEIEPPHYTYKAIEKLANMNNVREMPLGGFILGYDQFCCIENWKNTQYLKKMLKFIVIPRNKEDKENNENKGELYEPCFTHLIEKGYNFEIAKFERIDISSSQIREMVKNGRNIDNLVTESVKNYIYEKKLYH